ncbi:MAG TPA: DUF4337 domain-containing protein [Candidatus Limnocylindria bacterium]|jgi:hypothetical protein|nr:DUF4337 domain-containing protein [Candidatus Limnocylindria bacterium]
MEEPEVPIEQVHEDIHRHSHGKGGWATGVALTTALLAVLAAIASLLAGHYANDGVLEQLRASDTWNQFQAKSVKQSLLVSKIDILEAMGKSGAEKDRLKLAEYDQEKKELEHEARRLQHEAEHHMELHSGMAHSVTLFQVAIGISAIAVLTDRRSFWVAGILCGVGGLVYAAKTLL